ncbi:MAG: PfkB family carbohydrate kinase [Rhodobacter sp.]|nr:PfkB family carbohydrate kinase [Rhodobacter sp.]
MDFYADPPGTRLEDGARWVSALGGSSANIAAAICRQGGQAALVTCVSNDPVGTWVTNQLAGYGVDTAHVRRVGGEARNSLAVVDTNKADTQAVIYRNNAADFQLNARDIAAVDFAGFGAVVGAGTVLASEPSRGATLLAFKRAQAAHVPIVLDIDYRPYSWPDSRTAADTYAQAAAASDVIVGNDDEFGVLAASYDGGLDAARALAEQGKIVVYKMGHRGAITLQGDDEHRTGIFKVDALKPTGAGDAFMGTFLASLAAGHTLRDAVKRGSAAAAIVVTRVGCAPAMPTPDELDSFIAGHPGMSLPEE